MEKYLRNFMSETNRIKDILDYDCSHLKRIADATNWLRLADSAALQVASPSLLNYELLQATRNITDHLREHLFDIQKLLEPHRVLSEIARKQAEEFRSILSSITDHANLFPKVDFDAYRSVLAWNEGVSRTLAQIRGVGILNDNEALAVRIMSPSFEYASFIDRTVRKIKKLNQDSTARALQASLILTESQFSHISDFTTSVITPQIEIIAPIAVRSLRLPKVQQMELLRSTEINDDPVEEDLYDASPAAKTASVAQGVIRLVTHTNDLCALHETDAIFKPTTRFIEAVADIVWLLPTDRRGFADFIDCLYFIFYEGAGQNSLRYLKTHGGMLSDSDCSFIWHIKTFRNKWLRHDPEHGSPSDIRRSRLLLLEQFRLLGLSSFPRTSHDYRLLHQKLLDEASRFMTMVVEKINESGP